MPVFFCRDAGGCEAKERRSPPNETENKESFGQAFTKACGVLGEALQMEKTIDF